MSYLSLDAVSSAIYTALNVASLQALSPGGIGDDMGQRTNNSGGVFDTFTLFEVNEDATGPGLGSKPGRNSVLQIDLRVHVFWPGDSLVVGQSAMAEAIRLLSADNALTITGYAVCGTEPFYDGAQHFAEQIVAGVVVHEMVSLWRLFVTES